MDEVYNKWYLKYRDKMKDADDDFCSAVFLEGREIGERYPEYPLAFHIIISFMYELAALRRGRYTEIEKNKMIEVIARWSPEGK